MLDPRLVRAHPELVLETLRRRGLSETLLEDARGADEERRRLQTEVDALRAERNAASEAVAAAVRAATADADARAEQAKATVHELKARLDALQEALAAANEAFQAAMLALPNLVHTEVPAGAREEDARVVRVVGAPPVFAFPIRDHLALAGGMIDVERAARTAGSRFAYLLGDVALLWMALARYAVSFLGELGFVVVNPPVLVRRQALVGTGFFPGDENQTYHVCDDDLYLVGTSEVSLAALHMDEVLDEATLPRRYCGVSTCFRREAGAAGRDTRGVFRTHQFEKVEMFSFCHPDASWKEHEQLLAIEEQITQSLGLHYRVLDIAAGDLGASAARKYDIEAWLPGQERYRELTSCSNTTDFQARRLNCRVRSAHARPRPLHTLNGTAVTSSRSVIAILETHQRADGRVDVPEVLTGFGAPGVIGPA